MRGSGDDHVGTRESESAECGGQAERGVVANAFVRFAIGKRPEPGSENIHAADFFVISQAVQTAAPFWRNDAGGMIWKSREDRHFVTGLRPAMSEFGGAGGGRAHLGREVLGDVEDFHAKVEGIVKEECLR